MGENAGVQISAKSDYALRAMCALAAAADDPGGAPVKAGVIAEAHQIPRTFLDAILIDLRHAGLVESVRGPAGGHRLARPAYAVTVADVMRVIDGPLALVHGNRPESMRYNGAAAGLQDVWVAARAALRAVLEWTTLEHIVTGRLPTAVTSLSGEVRSWTSVWPPPEA
jgi:Rrf2 family protein